MNYRVTAAAIGIAACLSACVSGKDTSGQITIQQNVVKGERTIPDGETPYVAESGQRYIVTDAHTLPADMVVQGDRILHRRAD